MPSDKMSSTPPVLALGSRLRPSPYYEATRKWGSKAFSVYNHMLMPSVYESAEADYQYLTSAVTLWDVAAERQVQVSGKDAYDFVQFLTPRDISPCTTGRCRYILMTADTGGVINDPVMLRLADDCFWLSAADSDILLWCLAMRAMRGADVDIGIAEAFPLQLQGPKAPQVAEVLFGDWVRELKYFHMREVKLDGVPLVVSRTGWSGELGYEIYLRDGARGNWLWERIMDAGKPFGIRPASPSTIRRIEGGLLSYGADADIYDTPYHLGLSRLVNLDGGFDFCGKAALKEASERPLERRLTGVVIDGAPLPAPSVRWWDVSVDADVPTLDSVSADAGTSPANVGTDTDASADADTSPVDVSTDTDTSAKAGATTASSPSSPDTRVGKIRSAVYSPRLGKNIGIAMLSCPHDASGTALHTRTEFGDVRTVHTQEIPFIQSQK